MSLRVGAQVQTLSRATRLTVIGYSPADPEASRVRIESRPPCHTAGDGGVRAGKPDTAS